MIDGVELENANGEFCGGSFRDSFAHSCNSVFAPLGVKIGARRIVDAALRYGWNAPPSVLGEAPSTIPQAEEIVTPLEVGSTAIGQGKVLATPLRLASVAQTVGSGGVRIEPRLEAGRAPMRVRVTSRRVARTLGQPDARRGGLRHRHRGGDPGSGGGRQDRHRGARGHPRAERRGAAPPDDGSNTDAWFTAYAPARRPRIAVAVMLVRAGAGGETAAPAARLVLGAGARQVSGAPAGAQMSSS